MLSLNTNALTILHANSDNNSITYSPDSQESILPFAQATINKVSTEKTLSITKPSYYKP